MSKKTNRPPRAFWRFVFSFILIFGLFQGFLPKSAAASNVYLDDVSFFVDGNGYNKLSFHVLTTFHLNATWYDCGQPAHGNCCAVQDYYSIGGGFGGSISGGAWRFLILPSMLTGSSTCAGSYTMTAGNTYEGFINKQDSWYAECIDYSCLIQPDKTTYTTSNYWLFTDATQYSAFPFGGYGNPPQDTEHYYFSEFPSLSLTYPENDDEITENFYVTGTFTQPTPGLYEYLSIFATIAGSQNIVRTFDQRINFATSGAMSIWIYGLAFGYYDFDLMMRNNIGGYYFTADWEITNIHIVNDLPITLPPYDGQPPIYPPTIYSPLNPATYYTANSNYSTSTAFYTTLTNTFAPVLLAIGENLTNFAQNFTASNASSTGNQLGNSILLVRSYITNINSFFADFPVGQFLLLYLIALVVVIVLRLVKGLIGLFKL